MRGRWMIAVCLAGAGAAGLAAVPARAQDTSCNAAMVGTWLTTIHNGAGGYASRSLLTLHADGTIVSADSAQDKGVDGSSFSTQHGAWRCTSAMSGSGTTVNFGFPPRPSIARSDWTLTSDGKTLSGAIALHIFQGVKEVDPFRADAKPVDTFRFTAQRVGTPK